MFLRRASLDKHPQDLARLKRGDEHLVVKSTDPKCDNKGCLIKRRRDQQKRCRGRVCRRSITTAHVAPRDDEIGFLPRTEGDHLGIACAVQVSTRGPFDLRKQRLVLSIEQLERRIAEERTAQPRMILEGELKTGIAEVGGELAFSEKQLLGLAGRTSRGCRFWPRGRSVRRSCRRPAT